MPWQFVHQREPVALYLRQAEFREVDGDFKALGVLAERSALMDGTLHWLVVRDHMCSTAAQVVRGNLVACSVVRLSPDCCLVIIWLAPATSPNPFHHPRP